jgi:hypothetical protein
MQQPEIIPLVTSTTQNDSAKNEAHNPVTNTIPPMAEVTRQLHLLIQ